MKAIVSHNEEVSEMIYTLANLFRISIKNREMVIKIDDEISYCKSYLELHKIRHGDRLRVTFEINPDILNYGILKLILQPLIENSLIHSGLNESMNPLTITVKGFKQDGNIIIQVTDNGKGMDAQELKAVKEELYEKIGIKNNGSIGLKNVNDRIKIIFGEKFGVDISSEKNSYTRAAVVIPANTTKEINEHVQGIDSR